MRYLIAVLLLALPSAAFAGHGCRTGGYSGGCMADSQGDAGCGSGAYYGYGGSSGCGSTLAYSGGCGSGSTTTTTPSSSLPPMTSPLPETTIQPMPAPPQVPTLAPAPQRQTNRTYRILFNGEIVSKEFVDVKSSTGESYRIPILNGYLPQRLVDKQGELFDYSLKIPYTDNHRVMKDSIGYLTYTDSPEVRAIYVARSQNLVAITGR